MEGGVWGRGATLLNPLKIKPPFANFFFNVGGLRGLNPPKIKPPFDFLKPKGTDAESALKTVLPI